MDGANPQQQTVNMEGGGGGGGRGGSGPLVFKGLSCATGMIDLTSFYSFYTSFPGAGGWR